MALFSITCTVFHSSTCPHLLVRCIYIFFTLVHVQHCQCIAYTVLYSKYMSADNSSEHVHCFTLVHVWHCFALHAQCFNQSTCPQLLVQNTGTLLHWYSIESMGALWLSGRVLDSRSNGYGFEPRQRHYNVSFSKTHVSLLSLFVLLLYVPSQQLWSLRDGQFT